MSIIHDALKKVQQGQSPKPGENPATPAPAEASSSSSYVYASPDAAATHANDMPVEHLAAPKNKARSILALLCAIAFIIGSFVFLYKQLNTYFPRMERLAKSSFYQLIHKKEVPEFQSKKPGDLVPLAKILVKSPAPIEPAPAPAAIAATTTAVKPKIATPANLPTVASIPPLTTPETLNIHGVMSNGSSNVVLINDQVYQAGDEVDGVKIIKVDLDYITINNNGQEEKIQVKK
jgi:hypothetical protein